MKKAEAGDRSRSLPAINFVLEYSISRQSQLFAFSLRQAVQQGLFIAPADISKPFAENLNAIQDTEPDDHNHGWKIVIGDDVELRRDILSHLHRMNINRASLFPGLSGFAESFSHVRS